MSSVIRGRHDPGRPEGDHASADRLEAAVEIDAGAPSEVRELVRRAAANSPKLEDAMLLASELTTNAIIHGSWFPGDTLVVSVHRSSTALSVSVTGPGVMSPLAPLRTEPGGFGLALVDRLSARWGIQGLTGRRTRVWFELEW